MKRRDFVALGLAATAWPAIARPQTATFKKVGLLNSATAESFAPFIESFRLGLADSGYMEGQNVNIEYRFAANDHSFLPDLAAELISKDVDVLVSTGGAVAAMAAKVSTKTLPVVFSVGFDPVAVGLVEAMNKPGGNLTGFTHLNSRLDPKRIEILREVVADANVIAVLMYLPNPNYLRKRRQLEAAARATGRDVLFLDVSDEAEFDTAIAEAKRAKAGGVVVTADPYFNSKRLRIVETVAKHGIPAIYEWREFTLAGGLISYSPSLLVAYREVGRYTGRVLNGESPSNLPVITPSVFDLVVNLKTARTLGLEIPMSILALADEVIE